MDPQPYQTSINRLANKALADVLRLREAGEPVMLVLLPAGTVVEEAADPFPDWLQGEAY